MDSASPAPARDLNRAFFESNLDRLWLGERTREHVRTVDPEAPAPAPDGNRRAQHHGFVLGTPSDDLWLDRAVRDSPHDALTSCSGSGSATPRARCERSPQRRS